MEFPDATVAKTAPGPKGARRAEVVVNMHAIGARLHGLGDTLRDVLAEERLAGAAPPKGDSIVPHVGEPGNLVRLAVEAAAQALFVGLRKPFVVAAELGDLSDAAEELQAPRLIKRLCRGLASPGEDRGAIVFVGLPAAFGT